MNSKQRKTLMAIFDKPTRSNIKFSDIENLLISLGGELFEGRVRRFEFLFRTALNSTSIGRIHKRKQSAIRSMMRASCSVF